MFANWFLQLGLFVGIIFFLGADAPIGRVSLGLSPERLVELYGFADAGSYLQAAIDLETNNANTAGWAWTLNLWPPGMVWLNALILRFSPLDIAVSVGLISAFVWSLPFALLTRVFMTSWVRLATVVAIELAVLGTSPFQSWMLDEGLLYADGLAAALFLLGMVLLVGRATNAQNAAGWVRDGVLAGIALAGAVYFRASYQLVPVLILVVVGALVVRWSYARLRRRPQSLNTRRGLVLLVSASLATVFLMAPYTAYMLVDRDRSSFVQTEELVYISVWQDPQSGDVPQWKLNGGSALACDLDPDRCSEISDLGLDSTQLRDELVETILENPVEFVGHRVFYVAFQWFGDETHSYSYSPADYAREPVSAGSAPNLNVPNGILYVAFLVVSLVASVVVVSRGDWVGLVLPAAVVALLGPFAIVHVEVRYLIPLKLLALLAPLLIRWLAIHRPPVDPQKEPPHSGKTDQ